MTRERGRRRRRAKILDPLFWRDDFAGQVHAICDEFKRVSGVHREFARRCPIPHRYSYVSIERRPCGRAGT